MTIQADSSQLQPHPKHVPGLSILVVTVEWPDANDAVAGIHVRRQVDKLREAGVDVDVFHFEGRKNPLRYARARRALRRRDLESYDLLHAHHGQSALVCIGTLPPVVVTFHGSDLMGSGGSYRRSKRFSEIMLNKVSKWIASKADEIIVVSRHMTAQLPGKRVHVIPTGVDLAAFQPSDRWQARRELGLSRQKRLVLFVGDPERLEKRYSLAASAMSLVPRELGAELVVAHGVAPDMMPLYLNASNLMLVTSSSEGSPSSIKEALACDLPIVSVDVGDISERIGEIEGCFVCRDDDVATIAAAIAQALRHGGRVPGRAAIESLDERVIARKIIDVYRLVLERTLEAG